MVDREGVEMGRETRSCFHHGLSVVWFAVACVFRGVVRHGACLPWAKVMSFRPSDPRLLLAALGCVVLALLALSRLT